MPHTNHKTALKLALNYFSLHISNLDKKQKEAEKEQLRKNSSFQYEQHNFFLAVFEAAMERTESKDPLEFHSQFVTELQTQAKQTPHKKIRILWERFIETLLSSAPPVLYYLSLGLGTAIGLGLIGFSWYGAVLLVASLSPWLPLAMIGAGIATYLIGFGLIALFHHTTPWRANPYGRNLANSLERSNRFTTFCKDLIENTDLTQSIVIPHTSTTILDTLNKASMPVWQTGTAPSEQTATQSKLFQPNSAEHVDSSPIRKKDAPQKK